MIDRHGVKECSIEADYPPSGVVVVNTPSQLDILHYVAMQTRRQKAYARDELRGTGIEHATIVQLVTLDYNLRTRNVLFMSVAELSDDDTYQYYKMRRNQLCDIMNMLHLRGMLDKRTRKNKQRAGLIAVFGFTARGRAMLGKYYAYLSGEYDHLL